MLKKIGIFFIDVLKATDEKSLIRIGKMSRIRNTEQYFIIAIFYAN